MKILLVDDNVDRLKKMIDFLSKIDGINRDDIEDRRTSSEAREFLSKTQVDLLVLDILLPRRVEEEPSVANSLTLLTEISETTNLFKPRKVVGLTAYSEAAKAASRAFVEQTWTILESSETGDSWLLSLEKCIQYLSTPQGHQTKLCYGTDVLVITALRDPEMDAIRKLDWNWSPDEPLDDSTFFARGAIDIEDTSLSVVSAVADRMGMVSTAVLAAKLFAQFKPRLCVMPGICAGVRGKASIGDVVFADSCWDYQSGKFVRDESRVSGFEIDPHHINVARPVKARFEQLCADKSLMNGIWQSWPNRVSNPPKLLLGPVASGSSVLADSSVTEKIVQQQRKVKGIEMELYGLYLAAEQCPIPRPLAFGLKAVCDFADENKSDENQEYAAYVSARTTDAFLKRFGRDLIDVVDSM